MTANQDLTPIDSHFICVLYAITAHANGPTPKIVTENLLIEGNTPSVISILGGVTILGGLSETFP
jgi:hypothetical protein